MTDISKIILPLIVLFIVGYGLYKKIDVYEMFLKGVKEGLNTSLNIFPTIFSMSLAINILLKSNFLDIVVNFFNPLIKLLKIPKAVIPLGILRPISGSSTLIILSDILKKYGPDSFIGRVASVVQGSTDTTIYIIGLYFGSVGVKKIKHSLFVGLLTDLFAFILSIYIVKIIF